MGNPVGWFEIYVDDMERARDFYQAVFNVQLEKLENPTETPMEMWAFGSDMEAYGATGALVKMDDCQAGNNSTVVYFSCQNCAEEASRVALAGGTLLCDKMPIGEYGFIALARDTEGNQFGLHSHG
ncbi:VOC family protein [Motiliproteus sp.]|uniref:VOC family protein n=1 Tax=Motiliproteus sp. TaxID=1898955 RepID=UPI003BAD1AA7